MSWRNEASVPLVAVTRVGRGLRQLAGIAFAAGTLLIGASPASAHAVFSGSDPADGESLASAPAALDVRFDEAVILTAAKVELHNAKGALVASTTPSDSTTAALGLSLVAPSAKGGATLHITVPPLGNDVYQLRWRLVSADDYHTTTGALAFGVGQTAIAGGQTDEETLPSKLVATAGWADLAAMALLIGALGVWQVVLPVALASRRRRSPGPAGGLARLRLIRLATQAGAATCVTKILLLAATTWTATRSAGGTTVLHALGRQAGRPPFVAAVVSAAAIVGLLRREGRDSHFSSSSTRARTCAGLAVALLGISAQESHVTTARAGARLATVVLTFHLLGAAFWLGGVAALALVVRALRRAREAEPRLEPDLLQAFGPPAAASIVLLVLTGLHLTGRQVASVDAALRSLYGHVLGIKLALALVTGLVGLGTHRRLRRRTGTYRPGRALSVEVAVGVLLLASASTLALTSPARGARYVTTSSSSVPSLVSGKAADLFVTVAVSPNQPGRAFVRLDVSDTRRPAPGAPSAVEVTWTDPGATTPHIYPATRVEGSHWQVPGLTIATAGRAQLSVHVTRTGRPAVEFAHSWVVAPAPVAAAKTLVSRRPLAPIADAIALIGLALSGLFLASRYVRRGPGGPGRTAVTASATAPTEPLERPDRHQLVSASSAISP